MQRLRVLPALLFVALGCGSSDDGREFGVRRFDLSAFCTVDVKGKGQKDVETDYLAHVVQCENGGAPFEALKAQAVAARSYLYYKLANQGYITDGQGDQVYSCGATPNAQQVQAVKDTAGQVLRYGGTQVAAFFVAGAKPSTANCVAKGSDSDATNTEKYVTYNWNKSGNGIEQTTLGWVNIGNKANRGCQSQWGARCLADKGWGYVDILKFYYGMDIDFVNADGPCTAQCECTPGDKQSQACGNQCGKKTRTCGGDCHWNGWSGCGGEGACVPGDKQSQGCGNCGSQTRSCGGDCQWNGWGACGGQGPCAPGQVGTDPCGNCGTHQHTCSGSCLWGDYGACQGEGPCAPGQVDAAACGECGYKERMCSGSCAWGDYGQCAWLDPDGGTHVCDTTLLGACGFGYLKCLSGTVACVAQAGSGKETCDGADDDCDGATDEEEPALGVAPPPWGASLATNGLAGSLPAGTTTEVAVTALNVGSETWPAGLVVLRATGPAPGEPSWLRDESWPGLGTAAILADPVAPGGTATFTLTLRAPADPLLACPGCDLAAGVPVSETFTLVQTSVGPFACPAPRVTLTVTVTVTPATPPGDDAGPTGAEIDEPGGGQRPPSEVEGDAAEGPPTPAKLPKAEKSSDCASAPAPGLSWAVLLLGLISLRGVRSRRRALPPGRP